MKPRFNSLTPFTATLTAGLLAVSLFIPAAVAQVRPVERLELPDLDHRAPAELSVGELAQRGAGQAHLQQRLAGVEVDFDRLLGTPKFVRARTGFLTGPNGEGRAVSAATAAALLDNDPTRAVKTFLNENETLFGFGAPALADARVTRESVGAHNGLRTVVWQQQVDGLPVFESVLIGNITASGELVSLASRFLPDPVAAADAGTPNRTVLQVQPTVSAAQAIANASQNLGDSLTPNSVTATGAIVGDGFQTFQAGPATAHVRQVWLPMARGSLRLGWEVIVRKESTRGLYQILVDAETGEVPVRRSLMRDISDATYNVYTSDSPSPFSPGWPTPNPGQPPLTSRVLVTTSALDPVASPNGWINDGDNDTQGNNVETFVDRNFDQQADGPLPQGNPARVFDVPLDLTQAPLSYSNASVVQLFYLVNTYHDRIYQLGFTESFGNFQNNNFGRGGLGNDRIVSYVQSGADIGIANNAAFGTPPDGISGEMYMFVLTGPNPDRDSSLDAEVVCHEASHGTSQRLVGGGVLINALQTDGMGEGWGDFIGMSMLSEPADDPDSVYASGAYFGFNFFGLNQNYYFGDRHYPYCTDLTKNPFTFKDIDPAQISSHPGVPLSPLYGFNPAEADEVHHQGEIWCTTLWEVRANLVRKYGYAGNQLMLQLVIDGMKLGPANPNFLQARDAILLADEVNNGGVNAADLWRGFAKRGMGFSATSPDSSTTAGLVEAFDVPGLQITSVYVTGGNGNGVVDFNECNDLFIVLNNPDEPGVTNLQVTVSTTTPGVAFGVRKSNYPDLPAGTSGTNLVAFGVSTTPNFVCGTPIVIAVLIKSDQITSTNSIVLTTGTIGSPVRYDSTGPVPIPDANPVGTNSIITVSNVTSAIAKVTASVYLTHTYDSDIALSLIAPDGTAVKLSANHGGSGDNYGGSCAPETFRTTFDDAAGQGIGGANPPFIGTFTPDQPLSAFIGKNGTNANGIWKLQVVDSVGIDVGVIQCWSLFLSTAQCVDGGGTCPGADLALGMLDAPDPVFIGSNLVYTISVTNKGPSEAKTIVMNQLLPPSVVFVSAVTSQGSASSAGGTVTANLGTLPFLGKATVTVIVTPTTVGIINSSATVSSVDSDPDTSNNSAVVTTHVNPPTAELAVTLLDAPDPALVGGTLTYTVNVHNNGPSAASGVTVTNTLPLSVNVLSAVPSQGSATINGNVVVCSFGSLANGGNVTATITVSPNALGTIAATAQVSANQSDPIVANNTATATTVVGPAANLALTLTDTPDPVVIGSNWLYTITVVNQGPNNANNVIVSHTLPANVNVVSNSTTQGSIAVAGVAVTANLGTLSNGASAVITVLVNATNSGIYASSATVTAAEADSNPANNSASATTTVSPPSVNVVAAGATLTAESNAPGNGAVEPGETVTVQLRLRNAGNVNSGNLTATLLATNGVTAPGSPQNYGVLAPGGLPSGKPFTFTAAGTNGGTITATLSLQDGVTNLGNVTYVFALPNVQTFANTNYISITDNQPSPWSNGPAAPYPSTINVTGVSGLLGKVTVTFSNLNHSFPDDVDALLVSPTGQKIMLMSDAGGPNAVLGANVTFDDAAPAGVPDSGQIVSTAYRPTDYEPGDPFNAPAPPGTVGTNLSVTLGAVPNGVWSLYIMDDTTGDPGNIAGGWSLAFTTITPVNQLADLGIAGVAAPLPALVGSYLTNTFTVSNAGPNPAINGIAFTNVVGAGATLIAASSSPAASFIMNGNTASCIFGALNVGAGATVTIVVKPTAAGLLTSTASVTAPETDLNPVNNTVVVNTTVNLPVSDVAVGKMTATNSAVVNSNVTFNIVVTNQGPQTALAVVVSDPLPAGLSFVSTSAGSFTNSAGTLLVNLGDLPAGATNAFTITATATSTGSLTNIASVATASSDTNAANNSAAVIVVVTAPAPIIIAAGAVLTAESFSPPNGTVDVGETVTVSLALQNVGSADTVNLEAFLQPEGGVTAPSGGPGYGALVHGGGAVSRPYTFTATGVNGGMVTATMTLYDTDVALGTVSFNFNLPTVTGLTNPAAITIPDHGPATPYPSVINVSGVTGLVSHVTVSLRGVTHGFPDDVDVLLVGPGGQKVVLMSDAGGGHSISNLTLNFVDGGAALPDADAITTGTFAPTDYEPGEDFPSAPSGMPAVLLAAFNGTDPNGNWSLYVTDDSNGDAGTIVNGWSLNLTTVIPVSPVADVVVTVTDGPDPIYVGSGLTYTVSVHNNGPSAANSVTVTDALPLGLNYISAGSSQGGVTQLGGVVTGNLGTLAAGGNASVTILVAPAQGGSLVNSVSISAAETDLNQANNTAQTITSVMVPKAAVLSSATVTNGILQFSLDGEPNLTYRIDASTNLTTWLPVGTNTAAANGTIKFTDNNAPSFGQRYYRAVRLIP